MSIDFIKLVSYSFQQTNCSRSAQVPLACRILVACAAICQQQEQEFSHSFYSEKNMASTNAKVFILVGWCWMGGMDFSIVSANAVT